MKIDIKIIIRFLKEKDIYKETINIIKNRIKYGGTTSKSCREFLERNFINDGSSSLFFHWLGFYYNSKEGTKKFLPSKYASEFEFFFNKLKK